jgi:hypothetical protein
VQYCSQWQKNAGEIVALEERRWKKCAKIQTEILLYRQGKGNRVADQLAFDPQAFLAKIGAGRTLMAYQEQQQIFT